MYIGEFPVGTPVTVIASDKEKSLEFETLVTRSHFEKLSLVCVKAIKKNGIFVNLNGVSLLAKFMDQQSNREYEYNVESSSISRQTQEHILVSTANKKPRNRRDNVRVEIAEKANIQIGENGRVVSGYVNDISNSGVLLSIRNAEEQPQVGQYVLFSFKHPSTQNNYCAECVVKRTSLDYDNRGSILRIGCKFKKREPQICALVSFLQREQAKNSRGKR